MSIMQQADSVLERCTPTCRGGTASQKKLVNSIQMYATNALHAAEVGRVSMRHNLDSIRAFANLAIARIRRELSVHTNWNRSSVRGPKATSKLPIKTPAVIFV